MDPSPWSPYSQQPYSHLSSGSPQRSLVLPPSAPHEDSLNNYGGANPNPLHLSSCQGLQSLPPRTNAADPPAHPPGLPNSNYEALLSPPLHPSKESSDFFSETLFNGVCKENQSGIRNFLQTSGSASRNEGTNFPSSENSTSGYGGQVPSISFHSSSIDRPSPGPFGVLPHEAVMTRPTRFERNNDKFISPVSKTVSASYNSGPYTDRDVNSIYSSAPLSSQSSAFSGDNASLSPVVNSVTSPTISNFSSPSEYYSSPKPNFGAYNSLQSPVPQSPSVAQHSYPSSPFANVDPVTHIPSAPPCSPMSGGTYVNNLNQVPQRNGQKPQHSPSNSAGSNNVMCYNTPQSQNMVHHGPQSVLPKTPDYHSDYGVFAHDHNVSPSSYSSVYPAMHPGQMTSGNSSRISPRTHSQHPNSMPHDGRIPYGHPPPIPPSSISSPTYLQNKVSHEAPYGACSSNIPPGQSMHPSRYSSCSTSMNSMRNSSMHPNVPPMMPNHMGNDRQFGYQPSDIVDDKNALDMFNSHVDSGVHNPDNSNSITNFLENELPILDTDMLTNRQLRLSEPGEPRHNSAMNSDSSNRGMVPYPPMLNKPHNNEMPTVNMNYPYNSNLDVARPGNFTFNSLPRKRGRRGRRRKADINHSNDYTRFQSFKNDRNVYNNGYPMPPSKILEYGNNDCYNTYPKRICDMRELPPVNYPLSRYRSELKMNDNQKKKSSDMLPKSRRIYLSIEEELRFLGDLVFPDDDDKDSPHTFMKTRNKDSEGFLQCYKNFLANRKSKPEPEIDSPPKHEHSKKEHKEKHKSHRTQPKFIIRMGRCNNPGEWRLTETHMSPERFSESDESASADSVDVILSSHKIKQEDDTEEKSKRLKITGNLNKVSERLSKHSAKRKNDSVGRSDKYNDLKENRLHFTNSETLPAGKQVKIKTEILDETPSPPCNEQLNMPKKRGRKAKNTSAVQAQPKKKARRSSIKASDPINDLPVTVKQEVIPDEDDEVKFECSRRSTLRSRRDDTSLKEPQPGPSIKKEPIDISSDEVDLIDDSDSDPAWTPSAKLPKVSDPLKTHLKSQTGDLLTKRRRKRGRRSNSSSGVPAGRKKREKSSDTIKKKTLSEKTTAPIIRKREKLCEDDFKIKKEKVNDYFVIAKADLAKQKPPIWRVDKETNMLQRFDAYEEQGLQLHRNTYTYAAWNEMSVHNYIRVNVKVLSRSRILYVVQYLGPEPIQATQQKPDSTQPTTTNPLRENFEVFLQTLISQALDPNFLSEITNENDEYFLSNIKEIEKVTEDKKKILIKDTWDQDLRKCADTYPCVNILDSITDESKCQVCSTAKGVKLVQFYGQPYDWTTLGSVETPLATKTQFNVCTICSATVSLYNRLHHQKYNFFIKCRTKMNQVKGDKESIESHVLLEDCLQDHSWVNLLFEELEEIWRECDEKS